jgi:hypothetical protein
VTSDCRRIFCFFHETFDEYERIHLQYGFPANFGSMKTVNEIMEHGPSREEGSYLDNHREFMPKHSFKMRCENQLLCSRFCVFSNLYLR